jgi:hypothetical protein
MSHARDTGMQLHALERWRQLQLETAQSRHAELAARVEQQRRRVESSQQQCQATQELQRSQLQSAQPLAVDVLLRLTQFTTLQAEELQRHEATLASARSAADQAQRLVQECFEQLSVVQKLRARRGAQAREAQQRRSQRTWDEQAAGRAPGGGTAQL